MCLCASTEDDPVQFCVFNAFSPVHHLRRCVNNPVFTVSTEAFNSGGILRGSSVLQMNESQPRFCRAVDLFGISCLANTPSRCMLVPLGTLFCYVALIKLLAKESTAFFRFPVVIFQQRGLFSVYLGWKR